MLRRRMLSLDDATVDTLRTVAEICRREGLACRDGRWSASAACRMIVRQWQAERDEEVTRLCREAEGNVE